MRVAPPPVFPLLRSELQSRILARTYLGGGEDSVAALALAIGANPGNTAREIGRLERGDILASRRVGRTKLVRANRDAPFYHQLHGLITIVLGPASVLRDLLATISGIKSVDIYGSWAARYLGEPGPSPADIDVLVVGDPDRDELHDATQQASRLLNRDVNPVVISPGRWANTGSGFVAELRSRPRVPVIAPTDEVDA